jgi:6-phosphogluconolactonase/glucosamine-6-phosphate isomerase/deaminase
VTLTRGALTHARRIFFVVAGVNKSDALAHVLSENADPDLYPAAGIRAPAETVTWWLDRDAAQLLARS